jgi:hypothetical protein
MADLVSKYFKKDLTEAEDQALSERLLASPKDSLRMAQMAEKAYRRFGFPEPQAPALARRPSRWFPKLFGGVWFLPLVASAAIGTVAVAVHHRWPHAFKNLFAPPAPVIAPAIPTPLPVVSAFPTLSPEKSLTSLPTGPQTLDPALVPLDMALEPHRPHSDLAVIVRRHEPGEVTVKVLNMDGTEELVLFNGPLQKGKWIFDWDGRLWDGTPIAPGSYQILVESGPVVQRKKIIIRKKDFARNEPKAGGT